MTKVNGTDARTVALYFLDHTTDGRNTPAVIARTVKQAKNLMSCGYSVQEICDTIDHIIKKNIVMYSFGYLNTAIADVLRDKQKEQSIVRGAIERERIAELEKEKQVEVSVDVESKERNKRKAERISLQSGVGKKSYFDLFEGK